MAIVQSKVINVNGAISAGVAFDSNVTAANYLVFSMASDQAAFSSWTTSQSDTVVNDAGDLNSHAISHVASANGGATTVTLTCSGVDWCGGGIYEIDDTIDSVDDTGGSSGSSATATTGNITTTGDGWTFATSKNGTGITITENGTGSSPATGWNLTTEDESYTYAGESIVYRSTSSGTVVHVWDYGSSATWSTAIASYKIASAGNVATPSSGSIAFTGFAPGKTVTANKFISPSFASVVFNGFAPTPVVTSSQTVQPSFGTINFAGYAPTPAVTENEFASPSFASISFTGYAPTAQNGTSFTISPSTGAITFSGYAPAPWVSMGSGDITVVVDAPEPGMGQITFTGFAPTVSNPQSLSITAGLGSIAFTGYAPAAVTTASFTISPETGAVVFNGYAPTLDTAISPSFGSLAFTGYQPTVTTTNQLYAFPGNATLTFNGFAPTVTGGTAQAVVERIVAGGGPKRNRRLVILPDKKIALADTAEIARLLEFYRVPQKDLEESSKKVVQTLSRRQKRRIKDKAIPAPDIIAELEEEEEIQFVLKEVAKFLSS